LGPGFFSTIGVENLPPNKVQFATEQRSRACWEEICAENFQVEVYLGKIGSGKKGESLFVQVFRSSCWRDVLCKAF